MEQCMHCKDCVKEFTETVRCVNSNTGRKSISIESKACAYFKPNFLYSFEVLGKNQIGLQANLIGKGM